MHGLFIADTDSENIKALSSLLAQKHGFVPEVWLSSLRYHKFLEEYESAIILIRVDDCAIPGLELTQAALARGIGIHSVWMSQNDAHAVDAFRYGAEAYLLLPTTEEILCKTIDSVIYKKERI